VSTPRNRGALQPNHVSEASSGPASRIHAAPTKNDASIRIGIRRGWIGGVLTAYVAAPRKRRAHRRWAKSPTRTRPQWSAPGPQPRSCGWLGRWARWRHATPSDDRGTRCDPPVATRPVHSIPRAEAGARVSRRSKWGCASVVGQSKAKVVIGCNASVASWPTSVAGAAGNTRKRRPLLCALSYWSGGPPHRRHRLRSRGSWSPSRVDPTDHT
jgi:hypothetical protein